MYQGWHSLPGGINHLLRNGVAYCGLKGKDWRLPWEPGHKCRKCQVAYDRWEADYLAGTRK